MALLQALDSAEAMVSQVRPSADGSYRVASRSQPGTWRTCTGATCDCPAGRAGTLCWHKEALQLYRREEAKHLLQGVPFLLPRGEPVMGTRQQVRDQLQQWQCWADGALWCTPSRPLRLQRTADEPPLEVPAGLAIASLLAERWEGKANPTVRELQELWIGAMVQGFAERNRREGRCDS